MPTLPPKSFFRRIVFIQFFTALSWALISVVFPVLLKENFHSDQAVSVLYTLFNVVSLLTFLAAVPLARRLHQRRSFDLALLLMPLILVTLALATSRSELAILYAIMTFLNNIYIFNLDLYLPRLQKSENLMAASGKLGAIYNLAWVVGPFVGGLLAAKFNQPAVFYFSAAAAVIAFAALPFSGLPRAYLGDGLNNPLAELKKFCQSRFRIQAFINGLGLHFIYGGWFLLPLFLRELGADLTTIGLIVGAVGLPWVLLEIPIGRIIDRNVSSRTMFVIGYSIIAVMMILMGLSHNLWLFTTWFALAVVGSCFIEQTNTPYFVRSLDRDDRGLISIFLIKAPLGAILAPLLATFLLSYFNLGQVITIFGALTLVFVINALMLPRTSS